MLFDCAILYVEDTYMTHQEYIVHMLKLDGWSIVIWEFDKVCMVLRGRRNIRTRYCEVALGGQITYLKGVK